MVTSVCFTGQGIIHRDMKLENVLVANERRRPEEELETGDAPRCRCWDGNLGNIWHFHAIFNDVFRGDMI